MIARGLADGVGIGYSVNFPAVVSTQTLFAVAAGSVNHRFLSGPSAIANAPLLAVGTV